MNDHRIKLFTIGFTGSSAEHFFTRLRNAGVKKVMDTRLWAGSQLSGFAKKKDFPYFLKNLSDATYEYREELAPSEDILKAYKDGHVDWLEYEKRYLDLIAKRNLANVLTPDEIDQSCFLCACQTPHQCHRRLLAEYLQRQWKTALEILHL